MQFTWDRSNTSLQTAERPSATAMATPRILCATDLSRHATKVMTRAVNMTSQLDARLSFLQVVSNDEEGHAVHMRRQLSSLPPLVHRPLVQIRSGDYLPNIAAAADASAADLVVLDARPWKLLLAPIAATSGELAARIRRPALIVKRDSPAPYRSVLIAAEQSPGFDRALDALLTWQLLDSESVSFIHGLESPYRGPLYAAGFHQHAAGRNTQEWELAARRRLLRSLGESGLASDRFRLLFVSSRPVRELQREIRGIRPDLIVIATRYQAAVDQVLGGSLSNDLLRTIDCDILAMNVEAS